MDDSTIEFWSSLRLAQDRGRHFSTLLDALPDAIYLKDSFSRFTWVNAEQARNLGVSSPSEAVGKTDIDFLDAEYAASAMADERRIIETGEPVLDKLERVKTVTGYRWFSTTKVPLFGGHGRVVGIAGITRDITSRYTTEDALRAADRRYRLLFETMAQGVAYINRDGRVVSANPAAERILGLSLQELRDLPTGGCVWHPIDTRGERIPRNVLPFQTVMTTGRPCPGVVVGVLRPSDGERRWLWVDAAPIYCDSEPRPTQVCMVFSDITDSRRAEQALRDSEGQLRAIFEQAAVGMAQLSPSGRLLRVNDRLCEITGRSASELLGHGLGDIVHPGDREAVLDLIGRLVSGELDTHTVEKRYVRPDGSPVWVSANVSAARDEDDRPRFLIAVVQDISDRKRAERAMWESEYRFRSMFMSMPEGMALHETVYNEDGEPTNYRITEVNSQYEAIFGLRRDDVVGKLATEVYGITDAPYLAAFAAVAEAGTIDEFETYFEPVGKHLHISAAPLGKGGFATIVTDITERKRHAEIIQSILAGGAAEVGERFFSSMALQLATALGADCIVIAEVRPPDMRQVTTLAVCLDGSIAPNITFDVSMGPCADVALGRSRVYLDSVHRLFPKAPLAVEQGFEGFVGVPLRDGQDRTVGLIAAYFRKPITDVKLAESLLAIFATRTAAEINRMRADEERAMLQAEAMRMQHLSSLGVLAGGIAHDFNNILSAIIGYTELAAGRLPAEGREHGQLQQALAAAFRARDLVDQILAFSRQVKSDRKVIDLSTVVRESVRFLRATTPTTVELRTLLPATPVPVMGDATQLHQVTMNLCTNAVQAIGQASGDVTVTLGTEMVGPELAARLSCAEGLYAHMSVRDNGCGMDQATIARIFEPFYTTKDPGRGTGLGLATAHGVIADHGGAITVESEVGVGSVFHVYLPCSSEDDTARVASEADTPRGTERIMFVDDEPFLAEMAAQVLQGLGYEVIAQTDPTAAWQVIEQDPYAIDLLVTDQTMPQLTGLDLVERVRGLRSDLPIIIMTGYHQRLFGATPSELGVWDIVSKPYSIRTLGQAVRGALDSNKR